MKFEPHFSCVNLFLILLLGVAYGAQDYPGTATRPILNSTEASALSEANYLQGWTVEGIKIPAKPDYVVQPGQDIQAAVNSAINAGGNIRKYIQIQPGTYNQTVFIVGKVPLTIYGSGKSPRDVKISLNQPGQMTPSNWTHQVNPNGTRYKQGDPAYSIYKNCANKKNFIGTSCTSIFWIKADNIQVYNLQVYNINAQQGNAQAVALFANGDKIRLGNLYLLSRQDTLFVGSSADKVQRIYVDNSRVEGDTDFVFGAGSVVFSNVTFKAVSDRKSTGIVFAPSTGPNNKYGFLVKNSVITGDENFKSTKKVVLARSWDQGVAPGTYQAGVSPNGQLLITNTTIAGVINPSAPYNASTSQRVYSGNTNTSRDLNDYKYNRFWEFRNTGDGA